MSIGQVATKEHLTLEQVMPPLLRIRSDSYGSEATKDKQLSFAHASHVCDCQSYLTNMKVFLESLIIKMKRLDFKCL